MINPVSFLLELHAFNPPDSSRKLTLFYLLRDLAESADRFAGNDCADVRADGVDARS